MRLVTGAMHDIVNPTLKTTSPNSNTAFGAPWCIGASGGSWSVPETAVAYLEGLADLRGNLSSCVSGLASDWYT